MTSEEKRPGGSGWPWWVEAPAVGIMVYCLIVHRCGWRTALGKWVKHTEQQKQQERQQPQR